MKFEIFFQTNGANSPTGKIPENHFEDLLKSYDSEQKNLDEEIEKLQTEINDFNADSLKSDRFMELVRKNTEFKETATPKTKKLLLIHKGRDNWERPVYECDGRLYVDVDPRKGRKPEICTKNGNEFYGEPDTPTPEGANIAFVPSRDEW